MNNKLVRITTKVITIAIGIITCTLMLLALYNFFSIKILKKDYTNIFGYTFFEVVSGSMSPRIEKLDIILVKLDTEYNVNDIISYKSDNAIITHRIVEKKGDTYVTRGDANNTADKPISKDMIIGKVVKIYGNMGVWIKVLTNPTVVFGALISISICGYTISLFKKEQKEKLKEIEEEKINKEEYMRKIMDNTKLKIEICIFFALLIGLLILIPFTLSRFKTESRANAEVDVAFFVANDLYSHQEITLDDMIPGDTKSYTFSVSNFKENDRTEVNLKYNVEVLATTNIPFQYELYLVDDGVDSAIVDSNEIIQDEFDTYFRSIKTSMRNFSFDSNQTDTYKLIVKFPAEQNDIKYQDSAENIEIRVNAKQVIDSDL